MNIAQAVALTNMQKEQSVILLQGQTTKTAGEIAELVLDLSAAAGEPFENAVPKVWGNRWLASKKFVLVEIDPRQVAVPFVNRISHTKVLATMQASANSLPPIVVDMNLRGIGKTETGYVPSVIVVDGKHRYRAQVLCGRDRITAWVGEKALATLQARAAARKTFVVAKAKSTGRPLSKIEVQAALMSPTGGSPAAMTRQDTGDGGSRPTGGSHSVRVGGPARPVGTGFRSAGAGGASAGGGPGGGVSGLNPDRANLYSEVDPSDKKQFMKDEPEGTNPAKQSPGVGVGPRVAPDGGASHSDMTQRLSKGMKAGPIKVKKLVTKKKKMGKS